jgi:hypothetical protein
MLQQRNKIIRCLFRIRLFLLTVSGILLEGTVKLQNLQNHYVATDYEHIAPGPKSIEC